MDEATEKREKSREQREMRIEQDGKGTEQKADGNGKE